MSSTLEIGLEERNCGQIKGFIEPWIRTMLSDPKKRESQGSIAQKVSRRRRGASRRVTIAGDLYPIESEEFSDGSDQFDGGEEDDEGLLLLKRLKPVSSNCVALVKPFEPLSSEQTDVASARRSRSLSTLLQEPNSSQNSNQRKDLEDRLKARAQFVAVYGHNSWSSTEDVIIRGFDHMDELQPGQKPPTEKEIKVHFFGGMRQKIVTAEDIDRRKLILEELEGDVITPNVVGPSNSRGSNKRGFGKTEVTNLLQILNLKTGVVSHPPTLIAPSPRYCHAAAIQPRTGKCYIFGGSGSEGYLDDMWYLNVKDSSWFEMTCSGSKPPPSCGSSLAFNSEGTHLFLLGGWDQQEGADLTCVWQLQLGMNQWRKMELPSAFPPRRYFSIHQWPKKDDTLYVHHGLTAQAKQPVAIKLLKAETESEGSFALGSDRKGKEKKSEFQLMMEAAEAEKNSTNVKLLAITQLDKQLVAADRKQSVLSNATTSVNNNGGDDVPSRPTSAAAANSRRRKSSAAARRASSISVGAEESSFVTEASTIWVVKRKLREANTKLQAAIRAEALGYGPSTLLGPGAHQHDSDKTSTDYPTGSAALQQLVDELKAELLFLTGKKNRGGGATLPSTQRYGTALDFTNGMVLEFGGADVKKNGEVHRAQLAKARTSKQVNGDTDDEKSGKEEDRPLEFDPVLYLTRLSDGLSARVLNATTVTGALATEGESTTEVQDDGGKNLEDTFGRVSMSPSMTFASTTQRTTGGGISSPGGKGGGPGSLPNYSLFGASTSPGKSTAGLELTMGGSSSGRRTQTLPQHPLLHVLPEQLTHLEGFSIAPIDQGTFSNNGRLVLVSGGKHKADGSIVNQLWLLDVERLVADLAMNAPENQSAPDVMFPSLETITDPSSLPERPPDFFTSVIGREEEEQRAHREALAEYDRQLQERQEEADDCQDDEADAVELEGPPKPPSLMVRLALDLNCAMEDEEMQYYKNPPSAGNEGGLSNNPYAIPSSLVREKSFSSKLLPKNSSGNLLSGSSEHSSSFAPLVKSVQTIRKRTSGVVSCLKSKDPYTQGAILRKMMEQMERDENPPTPAFMNTQQQNADHHQSTVENESSISKTDGHDKTTSNPQQDASLLTFEEKVAQYEAETGHIGLHERYDRIKLDLKPYGLDQATSVPAQILQSETIKTCAPSRRKVATLSSSDISRGHQWFRRPVVTKAINDKLTAPIQRQQDTDYPAETASETHARLVAAAKQASQREKELDANRTEYMKLLDKDKAEYEAKARRPVSARLSGRKGRAILPSSSGGFTAAPPSVQRFEAVSARREASATYKNRQLLTKQAMGAHGKAHPTLVEQAIGPAPPEIANSKVSVASGARDRHFKPAPPLVSQRSVMNVASGKKTVDPADVEATQRRKRRHALKMQRKQKRKDGETVRKDQS